LIDALVQISYGTSYHTVLTNQLSDHFTTAIRAANDIIRSKLFSDEVDYTDVRLWLDNIGGYQSDQKIISTYIIEEDYTNALALLNTLSSKHNLSGDDLVEYNDYKTLTELNINILQQGRNIYQMTSNELAIVNEIADYGNGVAVNMAQNILIAVSGNYYYDCPSLPDNMPLKAIRSTQVNQGTSLLQIDAKPNPASTWVAFDYQLPPNCGDGKILIMDSMGQVLRTIQIDKIIGQEVVDIRALKAGMYMFVLEAGGKSKSGKLIVR